MQSEQFVSIPVLPLTGHMAVSRSPGSCGVFLLCNVGVMDFTYMSAGLNKET